MSHTGKTVDQLQSLSGSAIDGNDLAVIFNAEDNTTRKVVLQEVLEGGKRNSQGYYALLTNFYFDGALATETEIPVADTDTFVDVNFTTDALGTFDYRPAQMQAANPSPFDESTNIFKLDGLTTESSVQFRASMSFEPDEDEGQLEARLLFNRRPGTTPVDTDESSPTFGEPLDFSIESVALTMTQGADIDYPAEPLLSFFVGDTINSTFDANGNFLEAGQCRFQVKSSVPGTVRMRALTWYISQ